MTPEWVNTTEGEGLVIKRHWDYILVHLYEDGQFKEQKRFCHGDIEELPTQGAAHVSN